MDDRLTERMGITGLDFAVKMRDRKNFPIPDCFYKVTPFFSRSFLSDSTESTPVEFLTGANAFSRSTSNGQQLSIIWIMSRIKDSNL